MTRRGLSCLLPRPGTEVVVGACAESNVIFAPISAQKTGLNSSDKAPREAFDALIALLSRGNFLANTLIMSSDDSIISFSMIVSQFPRAARKLEPRISRMRTSH